MTDTLSIGGRRIFGLLTLPFGLGLLCSFGISMGLLLSTAGLFLCSILLALSFLLLLASCLVGGRSVGLSLHSHDQALRLGRHQWLVLNKTR